MPTEDRESNWFLWLIGISCAVAIFCAFYFFYYKEDYSFVVEVACDPLKEVCFQRDCSNPDDCPPNDLSSFKRFSLNASDFKKCANEDCTSVCETGAIKCEPVKCVENSDAGESCSTLENSTGN
ncbi:MAG: hypothetical protein NTZ87_03630 [Candidatus Nomurabacteria bacterium]|nr:hypothetical protein [Candidatus Nomurabacteria bacterium]